MREILFRGKQLYDGEWVYGDLSFHVQMGIPYVFPVDGYDSPDFYEVNPSTVGQYTGLKDKNGERIFEGDIVRFEDTGVEGFEYKEAFGYINQAVVAFENGRWQLTNFMSYNSGVFYDMEHRHDDFITTLEYCEIVGNIHDNPEILEEEKLEEEQ